jgi:hypothetical protein
VIKTNAAGARDPRRRSAILKITPRTFAMSREDRQLEEILRKISAARPGGVLLFPEYGAYTREGSRKAYAELSGAAKRLGVSVITTLNLPGDDLPHADRRTGYNTLCVFSRTGRTYAPQAKITPQSFEMRHMDDTFPKMNVAPYSHLNKTRLHQDGKEFTALFLICSDLYALTLIDPDELRADAIICSANFGNGAEGSAGGIIDYAVKSGIFGRGFLCNTHQEAKTGKTPLTVAVERVFKPPRSRTSFRRELFEEIVKNSSAVYADEQYPSFKNMLALTRNGTFTVPRSRSVEGGLRVKLGTYEQIIEL